MLSRAKTDWLTERRLLHICRRAAKQSDKVRDSSSITSALCWHDDVGASSNWSVRNEVLLTSGGAPRCFRFGSLLDLVHDDTLLMP